MNTALYIIIKSEKKADQKLSQGAGAVSKVHHLPLTLTQFGQGTPPLKRRRKL